MADQLNIPIRDLRPRRSAGNISHVSSRGGITRRQGRNRTLTPRGDLGGRRNLSQGRNDSRDRGRSPGQEAERESGGGGERDSSQVPDPNVPQNIEDADVQRYQTERGRSPITTRTEVPTPGELERHRETINLIKRLVLPSPLDPNAFHNNKDRDPKFFLDFATVPPTAYDVITTGPEYDEVEKLLHRRRFFHINGEWVRYTRGEGCKDILRGLGPPPSIERVYITGLYANFDPQKNLAGDRVLRSMTHRKSGIYGLENEGRLDERRRF